jgi:gluconokinase
MKRPQIFIVMGVSGSGKSTVGKLLAKQLEFNFFDGDDYHPEDNVKKMSNGIPLNDTDREGWLRRLNLLAKEHFDKGAVIACSALKKTYRDSLMKDVETPMEFVFLKGSKEQISQRLKERKDHFMPPGLLDSQFNTLESPKNAITVDIQHPPEKIVSKIIEYLKLKKP